jgi:putative restriction endonuclease
MWDQLVANGGPINVLPGLLRQLGIYGGAQGIWVNKEVTGGLSADAVGIAVGVMHNGSSYDDDLSEDGVIYHFPHTNRPGGWDHSETAALRNAFSLSLPVFVITNNASSSARRDVHLGSVTDIDDDAAQCLIEFSNGWRSVPATSSITGDFRLEANRAEMAQLSKRLRRNPRFAFEVGKRCGWRCAVCRIELKELLDAAHIRGVAERGSDDPRNGVIFCKNHHAAYDAGLFNFSPETGDVIFRNGVSAERLGISVLALAAHKRPHIDALRWRWQRVQTLVR